MLSLAGCQDIPFVSDQCQAEIKKNVINPETVEFFEKSDSSLAEFEESVFRSLKEEMLSKVDWSERSDRQYEIESEARSISTALAKDNSDASFVRIRMKADGRLGNKITAHMICAKKKNSCTCVQEAGTL
ncbi:MAG: hypothetical protein DI568_02580 [Sphingomonas sp.]|nr:MAG: hypothetical protein DI568_02580 [Sphingomonas sp.]